MFWPFLITEWNIQSRAHGCEACGKPFADQQPYRTLLFDLGKEFYRTDICASCWDQQFTAARQRKGFVSCWQGVYEKPVPPADAIRKETAETLLRRLIELNDPQYIPAGYILAVMLERKRLLKVKEQIQRDGHRVFLYEHSKTGDLFTIIDPNLHLDQLEQVQRDVAGLLEHGLNPATDAIPAPASSTASDAAPGAAPPAQPEPVTGPQ